MHPSIGFAATLVLSSASAMARPTAPLSPAVAPTTVGTAVWVQDTTQPPSPFKAYDKVITKDAKTRKGMFITHQVGDKLYFEIPVRELHRDMLMVGRFTRAPASSGGGWGQRHGGDNFGERVFRWERRDTKIHLRNPTFEITADSNNPVYQAVVNSNNPPIVAIFDIETWGPDSAAVIDVTRLYTTGVPEFAPIPGVDPGRSYIERVLAFPDNVEIEATQTTSAERGSQTHVAHWSMVRLPDTPMMPRLFDERVGYFSVNRVDFGRPEHKSAKLTYITRYRLEKKDPNAELSEPIKPIVYYVDPATPKQWVRWVKAGIEEWQPAFEAAGFKNGIIAKEAPSPQEDPDWSPEDIRHTLIRWLPSTVENAMGPHVHDPRSGEILNGSVMFYHNVMNLLRDWYWVQVGPLDPRVHKLPMPDSVMGRLLQYVVAHEVGHTLGFQHNMKASSTYPVDSLRSKTWLAKMGHVATLMDYSRFNYVAQPEDNIPLHLLVPTVGPYDKFATMWGYKPIPSARTPDEEKPTLDMWARMQDSIPWYRFSTPGSRGTDPGDQTEAVGDADAVKATGLGLRNIKRLVSMLIPATIRPGESNDDLEEMWQRLTGQWSTEIGHVVEIIGGANSQEKYGSQPGARFTPLSRARQAEAVAFLIENVFKTPDYFINKELLGRLEPYGTLARISGMQSGVLADMVSDGRLGRLIEYEVLATNKADCYTATELLADVQRGVWGELSATQVTVDPFRRNLQAAYVSTMVGKIAPAQGGGGGYSYYYSPPPADVAAQVRGSVQDLVSQIDLALPRAADRATRIHLTEMRRLLANALEKK